MKRHSCLLCVALACCGPGQSPPPEPPPAPAGPVPGPVVEATVETPGPDPLPPGTPHVTFDELLAGTLEPGTVTVEAFLSGAYPAKPCPEEGECKPCVDVSVLASSRPGTNPDRIWVQGVPGAHELMWRLVPYTFVLEIVEGYGELLGEKSCHPGESGVVLVDCPGCEELPIPQVTLEDLRGARVEPGFVKIEAYFVQAITPKPCPKKAKCQPCGSTTRIGEDPEDPDTWVLALGHPPDVYKLKKDRLYTFILDLREGYEHFLDHGTCDPRDHGLRLAGCMDCP